MKLGHSWLLILLLHLFNGLFPDNLGKPAPEKQNHSGKTSLDLLEYEIVSGSGISWVICKSAPHSRQITMPAPHHSVFFTGRMPFLLPNQQCQSTKGISWLLICVLFHWYSIKRDLCGLIPSKLHLGHMLLYNIPLLQSAVSVKNFSPLILCFCGTMH